MPPLCPPCRTLALLSLQKASFCTCSLALKWDHQRSPVSLNVTAWRPS